MRRRPGFSTQVFVRYRKKQKDQNKRLYRCTRVNHRRLRLQGRLIFCTYPLQLETFQ